MLIHRDIESRLVVAKGERAWGREGLGVWDEQIQAILYIGWINNKVLRYNTGNYIQYLVINHNGKEHIGITESLCCTVEINTTCKSTILQ